MPIPTAEPQPPGGTGREPAQAPPLAFLILLSALAVLPVNLFLPSLPAIAREFGADFYVANIAIAGYAVATAVIHLLAGALSDRYGRKPVVTAGLLVFTGASLGCLLADSMSTFLLFRMLQAAVIAGFAVSLAIIRDTAAQRESAGRIGYVSSAWAVAPMLGPIAGGLLDAQFGWRACFVLFVMLGLAALCAVALRLRETNRYPVASIATQFRGAGALLRSADFWTIATCMLLSIGTLYIFLGGAPLVAAQLGVRSTAATGALMALVPAGFITGSFVVGRYSKHVAASRFMLYGRLLTCSGLLLGLCLAAAGLQHPMAFFGPSICVGLGNGLTMPSANARVLALHPALAGTASGLASAITVIGAGLLAFASGLSLDAADARMTVLFWMFGASLLSLLVAVRSAATANAG